MNGRKIGTDELMPGWTDYEKRVLYYTYAVTDVAAQDNAVAVPVSSGWWQGRISLDTYGENDTAFLCVIETIYESGETETICSDLTWRGTTSGPVRYADIWDGEVYNANFDSYEEISMPSYPRSKTWKVQYEFKNFKGVVSPKVGPSVRIREFLDMKPLTAVVYEMCIRDRSVIQDGGVKMAYLSIVGSHSVNGVAELHTEILKNQELKNFHEF